MKIIKSFFTSVILMLSFFAAQAQSSENPWAIAVGADLISLQGENVDSKLKFGVPALSLSRYIGSGFSIGAQFVNGKSDENGVDSNYNSLDGILKYNFSEGNISPYIFTGYGLSKIGPTNSPNEAFYPSSESGRTILGGIGLNIYLDENFAINVSASYRDVAENDTSSHLQHIIGLSYNFGAGDSDKDGTPDEKDVCPDVPGLKEFDGCPDSDGDGIPDNNDRCPEEAGTEALQGCPDSDGDGVADSDDACPYEAGSASMNGCPDSDGDGVADNVDRCPQEAGDLQNDGCPWGDRDGDNVPDKDDLCPNEKGSEANKGCPEQPAALVEFMGSEQNNLLFSANSSKLTDSNISILETLKKLLTQYPNTSIVVEGHTSSDGTKAFNQDLSERRAMAVKEYLISVGVISDRIETIGYGETKPIGDNNTTEGRKNNRRVKVNGSAKLKIN